MNIRRLVFAKSSLLGASMLACLTWFAACADDASTTGGSGTSDASSISPLTDVAVSTEAQAIPGTNVRFVHLASNLGAIDFCLKPQAGETFIGPLLGGGTTSADGGTAPIDDDASLDASDAIANDAGIPGSDASSENEGGTTNDDAGLEATALAPLTMTNYISIPASGTFDVAVLEAGETSCSNAEATLVVTLDPGKLSTVALAGTFVAAGDASPSTLTLLHFTDDPTPDPDNARVRFIHAALGTARESAAPSLTVSAKGAESPVLATRVDRGDVATANASNPQTDALGYTLTPAIPPSIALVLAPIANEDAGDFTTWSSGFTDLSFTEGSLHSAFIASSDDGVFSILWCSDLSTVGKRVDCKLLTKPLGDQ